jgi:phosphopentomutase
MRALLIVLDSAGCGAAHDAAAYGDAGADTLGHIFEAVPRLALPNLFSLGLWKVITGDVFDPRSMRTEAAWGRARERSAGKDTTTGHWEIAGVHLREAFGTFTQFPAELVSAIEKEAGVSFIGNYPQSGTVILEELGAEHLRTGRPILYTSADSVMQIAAHEQVIPVRRLYEICRVARRHCDPHRIGRVIARPFIGEPGSFRRTAGRHDFSMVPPPTVLNALSDAGLAVHGVGKISDIFAGSGLTNSTPTNGNTEGMQVIEELWASFDEGLIFANLVDFDALYGHRRDVVGYAAALVEFDAWLGNFLPHVDEEDLVVLTADHGNDPAWKGSDHTREEVPLLVLHQRCRRPLGTRKSFADIAATLADFFYAGHWQGAASFLPILRRR